MTNSTKASKNTISKFFPETESYVRLKISETKNNLTDWELHLTLQESPDSRLGIWAANWSFENDLKYLQEMKKAVDRAVDFLEQKQKTKKKPIEKDTAIKSMKAKK